MIIGWEGQNERIAYLWKITFNSATEREAQERRDFFLETLTHKFGNQPYVFETYATRQERRNSTRERKNKRNRDEGEQAFNAPQTQTSSQYIQYYVDTSASSGTGAGAQYSQQGQNRLLFGRILLTSTL
jgi:phage repressor protein C with HTH and peptisase S24 domain